MATIHPLNVGQFTADRSFVLYLQGFGEQMVGVATAFLVRAGERAILVDTGFNRDEAPHVRNFRAAYPGGDAQRLLPRLAALGVGPDDVDSVINTHLHLEHAGGNYHFPRARFHVQREELRHAYVPDEFFAYYFRDDFDVGVDYHPANGDAKLADGVRVLSTPGHSPGHQSVLVETSGGDVLLCGDACPTLENWTRRLPTGIHHDPSAFMDSLDRMQSLEAEPVFCHDVEWWKRRGWGPWE